MAQRVIRELVDDLTGDRADETVTFGIDGKWYEMDLSSNNAGVLRDIFGDYVKAARKVPASGRPSRTASAAPRANREQMRAIREWAKSQPGSTDPLRVWLGMRTRVPPGLERCSC